MPKSSGLVERFRRHRPWSILLTAGLAAVMVSVLQWAVTYEHIPRYPTTALATAPGSDSVAFSPDGKILATWGAMQEVWPNELVWLWDVAGRRRIATFTVPSGSAARDQPPPAAVEL